jgi:MFS family permease
VKLGRDYRRLFAATTISNLGDGVGAIAYPWLASAVTRDPLLIALVGVAQRLPWLLFTLPAGVITDRSDRRRLMVGANVLRAVFTLGVAVAVVVGGGDLPASDELERVIDTDVVLYLAVIVATLLMGVAEVLYDNSAQTFMPELVEPDALVAANGRMYSGEIVANNFVGPPLGSILLAVGFAFPFFVDAGTFAVSAALIFLITSQRTTAAAVAHRDHPPDRLPWRTELAEGVRWLWGHSLIRTLAIYLGVMNLLGAATQASIVLFGQEVLGTSPTEFAVMFMAMAIGGVVGGWSAGWISQRVGSGPSLWLAIASMVVTDGVIAFASDWWVVFAMFGLGSYFVILWNVITVSLRQTIIPPHLLGRVNSVYRFFGWGMIPVGALVGGLTVAIVDTVASRETALRAPWVLGAVGHLALLVVAVPRLTTARLEAARAAVVDAVPVPT